MARTSEKSALRTIASIAAPSVAAHSRLVQQCYRDAGVDPRDVHYIEAQGMGNPAADIAEHQSQRAADRGVGAMPRPERPPA